MKDKNIVSKLKDEILSYEVFCDKLFSVRYTDCKPEDVWYDEERHNYDRVKARIELLFELLNV